MNISWWDIRLFGQEQLRHYEDSGRTAGRGAQLVLPFLACRRVLRLKHPPNRLFAGSQEPIRCAPWLKPQGGSDRIRDLPKVTSVQRDPLQMERIHRRHVWRASSLNVEHSRPAGAGQIPDASEFTASDFRLSITGSLSPSAPLQDAKPPMSNSEREELVLFAGEPPLLWLEGRVAVGPQLFHLLHIGVPMALTGPSVCMRRREIAALLPVRRTGGGSARA